MNNYPCAPEEQEEPDCKVKEPSCQTKEEEKHWARIEKEERAAEVLANISLVFSIIALLVTLAKRL